MAFRQSVLPVSDMGPERDAGGQLRPFHYRHVEDAAFDELSRLGAGPTHKGLLRISKMMYRCYKLLGPIAFALAGTFLDKGPNRSSIRIGMIVGQSDAIVNERLLLKQSCVPELLRKIVHLIIRDRSPASTYEAVQTVALFEEFCEVVSSYEAPIPCPFDVRADAFVIGVQHANPDSAQDEMTLLIWLSLQPQCAKNHPSGLIEVLTTGDLGHNAVLKGSRII